MSPGDLKKTEPLVTLWGKVKLGYCLGRQRACAGHLQHSADFLSFSTEPQRRFSAPQRIFLVSKEYGPLQYVGRYKWCQCLYLICFELLLKSFSMYLCTERSPSSHPWLLKAQLWGDNRGSVELHCMLLIHVQFELFGCECH